MAFDFAQVENDGQVTGRTVRLDLELHYSIIQAASPERFPLLARMREYYEDVGYESDELPALAEELRALSAELAATAGGGVVQSMLDLVENSIEKGVRVEGIAD